MIKLWDTLLIIAMKRIPRISHAVPLYLITIRKMIEYIPVTIDVTKRKYFWTKIVVELDLGGSHIVITDRPLV